MVSTIVGSYCKAIGVIALVRHVLSWRDLSCERVGLPLILYIIETSEGMVVSRYSIPVCVGTFLS